MIVITVNGRPIPDRRPFSFRMATISIRVLVQEPINFADDIRGCLP
jgi:hypothetical protein